MRSVVLARILLALASLVFVARVGSVVLPDTEEPVRSASSSSTPTVQASPTPRAETSAPTVSPTPSSTPEPTVQATPRPTAIPATDVSTPVPSIPAPSVLPSVPAPTALPSAAVLPSPSCLLELGVRVCVVLPDGERD